MEGFDHGFVVGELSRLEFGVDFAAVDGDFEATAGGGDEGERGDLVLKLEDFLRQTDGMGLVVSSRAVFDDDLGFHGVRAAGSLGQDRAASSPERRHLRACHLRNPGATAPAAGLRRSSWSAPVLWRSGFRATDSAGPLGVAPRPSPKRRSTAALHDAGATAPAAGLRRSSWSARGSEPVTLCHLTWGEDFPPRLSGWLSLHQRGAF